MNKNWIHKSLSVFGRISKYLKFMPGKTKGVMAVVTISVASVIAFLEALLAIE